ncbi:hypothetical protein SBOR_0612 [Sclerotinia borealis F-4128]|uniref:Uncharacterized protein n=1 Tax=Sclerotinia borealis (strain F-4128) TaxID=1432307 RepID=W9CWE3_SCLBF|nr:hypothetical protein SBOR_0612 [Sclerotinia borealis F-4128]
MYTKNIIALVALTGSVIAAPLPSPALSSLGSAVDNLNGNGDSNSAGNGNWGNGNNNGDGSGSNDGNGNVFGNGNAIGSDNSEINLAKRGSGSNILGSALGNLNDNGGGNAAGDGNSNNSNGVRKDRATTTPKLSIRNPPLSSSYVNGVWVAAINPITNSLSSSGDIATTVGTATDSLNNNGISNTAGSSNSNNGNGNGNGSGSNNGNGNTFGNHNEILSNNGGVNVDPTVRRQSDAFDLIPNQTITELNKDASQLLTIVIPSTGLKVVKGALTGTDTEQFEKRQLVLTGLGDIIAQDVAAYIP